MNRGSALSSTSDLPNVRAAVLQLPDPARLVCLIPLIHRASAVVQLAPQAIL
jgi:hypothetical protein